MDEKRGFGKIEIERMALEDLDEVLAIERDSFSCPWSMESFRQEVANRKFSFPLVAKIDGRVVGYGVAWFVADETHIGNIAVHRTHRRKGIGRLLLQNLLENGLARGCQLATLEVRQTNRAALGLYKKFGFWSVALRKGYYRDTGEDAIVLIKDLGPHPQPLRRERREKNGVV
ncbi:MAG: ribosomal protein S18-alanine N-acetyltransferase [bacterium]